MDTYLIEYLKSGKAWILVGSGPSIEAGYPSWERLARLAVETAKAEHPSGTLDAIEAAFDKGDFPGTLEEGAKLLGKQRLRSVLRDALVPTETAHVYELIARWPVDVYLTTNFDDAISQSLARLTIAYTPYSNGADHMDHLTPSLRGAIVKLHGDLRSDDGLILTSSQYDAIRSAPEWKYWRDRMTSIFQMCRLVVIGHSLSDPHIAHLLEAAKQGASVVQPICWLAPDVSGAEAREYLEKYRIRVIAYDNRDGRHTALIRLLKQVSQFVPARTSVTIRSQIARVMESPLGRDAGAPGFLVFNKLSLQENYEEKRLDIALVAIEAAIDVLEGMQSFSLPEALKLAGWPASSVPSTGFLRGLADRGISRGLLDADGDTFRLGKAARPLTTENRTRFEEMRDRFKQSVALRVSRLYPSIPSNEASGLAADVEASLTGFFREGGLTLATALFSVGGPTTAEAVLPTSILGFMSEASNRYADLLRRQAFIDASLEMFLNPELAEREYLGRVSQGFFAFHALGVFGDVAVNRLLEAQKTVWLIDSHVQISALALGATLHGLFRSTLLRLKEIGVRLFTTRTLFEETREHQWFANKIVRKSGAKSVDLLLAAGGETPYRKSNQFLQGFVAWQASTGRGEWETYLFEAFGQRRPSKADLENALLALGIAVIDFQAWPGFQEQDFVVRDQYVDQIAGLREQSSSTAPAGDDRDEARRKALPEAESLVVVTRERAGTYHILLDVPSPAWLVSDTGILNHVESGARITWQPEAFLRFVSTLAVGQEGPSADAAFDAILWAIARSGLNMVDAKAVQAIFGGIVDDARVTLAEQRQLYHETLETKYGASPEAVLESVPPKDRPLAAVQLLKEMLDKQSKAAAAARLALHVERKRADKAEKSLKKYEAYKRKLRAKEEKAKRNKRRSVSRRKAKRGRRS